MSMMSAHQRIRRAMAKKEKEKMRLEKPDTVKVVDFERMSITELRAYSKIKGINISGLNKKEDIKARIIVYANGDGGEPPADGEYNGGSETLAGEKKDIDLPADEKNGSENSLFFGERIGENGANGGTA